MRRMSDVAMGLAKGVSVALLALGLLTACGSAVSTADDVQGGGQAQSEVETTAEATDAKVETTGDAPAAEESQEAEAAATFEPLDGLPFSYGIPAYWEGKVEQSPTQFAGGSGVSIFLAGNPDAVLVRYVYLPGDSSESNGDIGTHNVGSVPDGTGNHVEVWTINWPWLAAKSSSQPVDEDTFAQLVNLSTGGAVSYQEAQSDESGAFSWSEADYSEAELVSTVSFG